MDTAQVILVDADDNALGTMEKQAAHVEGKLHRAFSVFLFDGQGRLLLQRRALDKYHSGGLWTNTCCSHPQPGEGTEEAAHRRLQEEMGIDAPLEFAFSFLYRAEVHPLIEHELDHVFFGSFEGQPCINLEEVADWKWVELSELEAEMELHPENYTAWLRICLARVVAHRGLN